MVALRDRLMQRWSVFDVIPFEDGDSIKVLGEHPRGHQSREAPADDDSMLTEAIFHCTSPSVRVRNGLKVTVCGSSVFSSVMLYSISSIMSSSRS